MKKRVLLLWVVVLTSLGVGFCFFQRPAYLRYKEERAVRRAQALLVTGDFANASLSARSALQLNPRNLEACRFMADLAESAHSPAAIDWRLRIVELAPALTNQLELAATALKLERPPFHLAAGTLAGISNIAQDVPNFHALSALVDLKSARPQDALKHFRDAARLAPANPVHRLDCAVLELQSPDAAVARSAASELLRLTQYTNLHVLALRSLTADQLRRNNCLQAKRYSDRLILSPDPAFEDQLVHLTILQTLAPNSNPASPIPHIPAPSGTTNTSSPAVRSLVDNPPETLPALPFREFLRWVQDHSAGNPREIFGICEWMQTHGLADAGLQWLEHLDERTRNTQPIPFAQANLYAAMHDWIGLVAFLKNREWREMEFLRQALLARAAWGQKMEPAGDARWRCAIRNASTRLGALMVLLKLSEEWNKDPEEILWTIWRGFPREKWASTELERTYLATGNTPGLNLVYDRRLDYPLANLDITNRNDFTCTSLLLGVQLPRAHSIARQLYTEQPKDPILASTFAYSLHLQGKTTEGLQILGGFDKSQLDRPAVALYYGLLLAKAGEANTAKHFLELAQSVQLSPEESRLLEDAKERLLAR